MTPVGLLVRGIRIGTRLDVPTMAARLRTSPRRLELVETGAAFPTAAERRAWSAALGFGSLIEFDRLWRDTWARVSLAHRSGYIPVINKAPAGPPVDFEEYGIDSGQGYEYVPRSADQETEDVLFAVVILGDSMAPAYRPGDLVVFRPVDFEEVLPDGSPVFVRFAAGRRHACTVKRLFRHDEDALELRPDNPRHASQLVRPDEIDRMAVAIERRAKFWEAPSPEPRFVPDEYAQDFPEE